ncbi:MAG TPA: tRNA (adenosine(37)-N6)-threonylcarbamoyltransferase complex transferase subunit TsaD, partial [Acholeplasma sp.]|nr:tRNA (adenosine(37)-N6)-threonylcarbamoyltransferase complex transferase subunit TsaD [Acholeplasma sp.]
QNSVMDVLIEKTKNAANNYNAKQVIVVGGVAANSELRRRIKEEITNKEVIIPKFIYCTDNAAMIAAAAFYQLKKESPSSDYIIKGFSTKQMI